MKVLFAVQGTGNGHLARARTLVPILAKYAEVDVLVSGSQVEIDLGFPVKYRFYGLGFVFGKNGGVSIPKTIGALRLWRLFKDWNSIDLKQYDLVVNDFEPITAWKAKFDNVLCLGFSHQRAVLHPRAIQPLEKDRFGEFVLKNYAPTENGIGFHFKAFDQYTQTPVVRDEIRALTPENKGHYSVYLPAYSTEILVDVLQHIPCEWHVFSKHSKEEEKHNNVWVRPVNSETFVESMRTAEGVLCGAGFETPAEALYWNKKLMVIPMTNQYEQHLNAESLADLGIPVLDTFDNTVIPRITKWMRHEDPITVSFPDNAQEAVEKLLQMALKLKSQQIKKNSGTNKVRHSFS